MSVTNSSLLGNAPPLVSKKEVSLALKITILAICAVAGAALGFLAGSYLGLTIGGMAGMGLGIAIIHLLSRESISEEMIGIPTPEEDIEDQRLLEEWYPGPPSSRLTDPKIKWLTGTQSPILALMLATHRQGKIRDLAEGPALINLKQLLHRGIVSLTGESYGKNGSDQSRIYATQACHELTVDLANKPQPPFNLYEAFEQAFHIWNTAKPPLPRHIAMREEFNKLQLSIIRLLQSDLSEENKARLRAHIQNDIVAIFASQDTFKAHIGLEQTEQYTRLIGPNWLDNAYDFSRNRANELLSLFDQIEPLPLTPQERDLVANPCPLVFGSKKRARLYICEDDIDKIVILGQDLQYIYTTAENIDRIREVVLPYNVEVRDLDTLMQPND